MEVWTRELRQARGGPQRMARDGPTSSRGDSASARNKMLISRAQGQQRVESEGDSLVSRRRAGKWRWGQVFSCGSYSSVRKMFYF